MYIRKPKSGYWIIHRIINRTVNFFLSLFFLILTSPLFLIISMLIKAVNGSPVFYSGIRLGKDKKEFKMYKFRTLIPSAENLTGAQIIGEEGRMVTKCGSFLRKTRLDELPQLINILKGDMNFMGPRPERPAVYQKYCKLIKDYEYRFKVKPGLIGYSQFYTPARSPKKLRSIVDNFFVKFRQILLWDFVFIFYVGFVVGIKTVKLVVIKIKTILTMLLQRRKISEERACTRVKLNNSEVYVGYFKQGQFNPISSTCLLVDINEEAFLMYCNEKIPEIDKSKLTFKLVTHFNKGLIRKRKKKKTAFCLGTVYRNGTLENGKGYKYFYVIKYEPLTSLNFYNIEKYFLHNTLREL